SKSGPLIVLKVSRTASLVTDMATALSVCLDRSGIDHFRFETKPGLCAGTFCPTLPAMIDKLEYFLALARARHFGKAAEELGIAQPTLSAGIKQLEDILAVMLVLRGSRFRGLTPEGEQVLSWARRIVSDTRAMKEEMRASRHGLSGRLRIAAIPTALAMVPALTTPFREKHPGVTFTVLSRTSVEVLSMLGNFDIDAGITYLDNEPLGRVVSVPLYSERYQLITAAGNPLSD